MNWRRRVSIRRELGDGRVDDLEANTGVRSGCRILGEEIDPGRLRHPISQRFRVGVGAGNQSVEAAKRFPPIQGIYIILDTEHREVSARFVIFCSHSGDNLRSKCRAVAACDKRWRG